MNVCEPCLPLDTLLRVSLVDDLVGLSADVLGAQTIESRFAALLLCHGGLGQWDRIVLLCGDEL